MSALIRLALLIAALAIGALLVAAHGIRGLGLLVLLLLATTVPRTRVWQVGERFLVRVTGSRRRALVLLMSLTLATIIVVNVVQLVR